MSPPPREPQSTAGAERPTCPTCATPLPPRAPEGLCPRCLLDPSLSLAELSPPGTSDGYTVPSAAQLAPLLPRYELGPVIGRGGMGVVFAAHDPRLERTVAIKVLPAELAAAPAFEERFAREARTQARLAHPFTLAIHDWGEAGPFFYLVLEHAPGGNLRQALARGVSPEQALRWLARVCEALGQAHAQGVVHRDIKPENILLDGAGNPRLADFGLAKLLPEAADRKPAATLTGTGTLLGSLHYMAPEQLRGGATRSDARSDVYAVGVVLYELLTGALPMGRFPLPSWTPGVPRAVDPVVLRCLEREPEQRYPDAAALGRELEALLERRYPRGPRLRAQAQAAAELARRGVVRAARRTVAPAFDPRGALAAIALGGAAVVIAGCFRWAGYDYGWEEYPGLPLLALGVVALALVQRLRPRTGVPSWLFAGAGLYALVHWTVLWVAESLHFAAYVAGGALLVLATAALRLVRGTRRAAAPTAAAPAPVPAETPVIPADDERDERPPSSHETPTTGAWAIRAAAREATDGVEPS